MLNQPLPKNPGTPQFWKVFFSCVNATDDGSDFAALQASTVAGKRIANKIALLNNLRENGVWLVDTSLAALYGLPRREERSKPSSRVMRACLQASWDLHVRGVVQKAAPSHIVCIGKGVHRALRSRLGTIQAAIEVVPQPNAHLTKAEHHEAFRKYFEIVRQANGQAASNNCYSRRPTRMTVLTLQRCAPREATAERWR